MLRKGAECLFDLDGRSGFGELGLDLFGFVLRNAFFQGLRSTVDEVLCFLQAETCNDFANDLDDRDLVAAGCRQNDVEESFSSAAGAASPPAGAAIIIGAAAAAAETPKTSSSSLTNSDASRSVMPFKYSTTSSFVIAMIFIYLLFRVL